MGHLDITSFFQRFHSFKFPITSYFQRFNSFKFPITSFFQRFHSFKFPITIFFSAFIVLSPPSQTMPAPEQQTQGLWSEYVPNGILKRVTPQPQCTGEAPAFVAREHISSSVEKNKKQIQN